MKNSQKSLVVSLLSVIFVLVIGGGVYIYKTKKVEVPALIGNTTQQSDQDQNIDSQNGNVTPTPTIQDNLSLSKIITIISPSAGSVLQVGKPHKITWSGIYERGDEVFEIDLFSVGSDTHDTIAEVPIAEASCIGGRTMSRWGDLSTCSYVWTPKGSVQKMQIRINNKSKGGQSGSSGVFSINHTDASLLQPSITVLLPNGGEVWKIGSTQSIRWNIGGSFPGFYKVGIFLNGGLAGMLNVSSSTSYTFTVPSSIFHGDVGSALQPGQYKVKVIIYDGEINLGNGNPNYSWGKAVAQDESDLNFSIVQ